MHYIGARNGQTFTIKGHQCQGAVRINYVICAVTSHKMSTQRSPRKCLEWAELCDNVIIDGKV